MPFIPYNNFSADYVLDDDIFTSEKLLFVIEAVSLDSGELIFVLLNNLLQSAVQILLLLLQKLLFLDIGRQRL